MTLLNQINLFNPNTSDENTTKRYDLSLGQKALWFIDSLGGSACSVYNESLIFSLKGKLSTKALAQAFDALIMRHEILRTSFDKDHEGNIFQVLHRDKTNAFSIAEVNIPPDVITNYINAELLKPFDLGKAPLMRATLIQTSADEYILIIVQHHIITDGMSSAIFIKDLSKFYNQFLQENCISINNQHATYFDYVDYEKARFNSTEYQEKVTQLTRQLKNYAGLNFLTTPNHEVADIFTGDRIYFELDKTLYEQIKNFCKTQKMTLFHFLITTYSIFVSKYTRSEDIVVGVPFANRDNDPERQIMGYFINTLPLRFNFDPNKNFVEMMHEAKALTLSYFGKQEVAFEHIASGLDLERKVGGLHPLIQTMFAFTQNASSLKLDFTGIECHLNETYFPRTAKFDLSLFMSEENKDHVKAFFEFRTHLFDHAFIHAFVNNFCSLIENIIRNPEAKFSELSMLDEQGMRHIKEKFFTTKLDRVVNATMGTLFSQTAKAYPLRDALTFEGKSYNYRTAEAYSNQWAKYIRNKYKEVYGVDMPRDTLVGLCVDRNEDMIFGMLGILKAGAAYVPIDPKYPKERIDYIISDSKVPLLLTHHVHDHLNLNINSKHVIYMDTAVDEFSALDSESLPQYAYPEDTAYVLYTSGSTGRPKGVSVTHENIICLFESLKREFILTSNDVWSLFHTFCFDISVWEIWGAFLFGGRLIVIPYESSRDPKQFYQILKDEHVTVLTQTASAFQMLINEDLSHDYKLKDLRYVGFVGESLKVSILRPWVEKYGVAQPQLVNLYGITETTVYTNYKFIEQKDIDKGRDNIGWPLQDYSLFIMDEHLKWCPVGIVGEIYIGGRGLARGYLNRDDLTQEKFITDPYANFLGIPENSKLYRTGDLGRWLEDGSVEYLGRKDFQIKLRGFRIELAEIESALGSYDGVSHVVALLKGVGDGAYIAAYYTLKPGLIIEKERLLLHLKSFLPEYMVPKVLIELDSFPMTVNGKVDRRILEVRQDQIVTHEVLMPLGSDLERDIASVWAELLKININKINANSNFFSLGGNSLLVVKMLTQLNKKLNKEISVRQFIAAPVLNILANSLNCLNYSHKGQFIERLKKDICLAQEIQPLPEVNPNLVQPKNILLTGATGFLGGHMLYELIQTTTANIYCLIRADTITDAWKKLKAKAEKYKLWNDQYQQRVIPILSDIAEINLGLTTEDFKVLAEKIDSIYHVGAWVHHIFDYHTLYNTNVRSVLALLKLACTHKNKALHFISTFGAQCISPLENLPLLDERSNVAMLNMNGYLSTKWLAEQLLSQASVRRVAVHVYRPGNIIAGNSNIYEPENNHMLLRLKGFLQLGLAYVEEHEALEMVPVDLLAQAIIKISNNPEKIAYNLHNGHKIAWKEYLYLVQQLGYRIKYLQDSNEWSSIISSVNEKNALYKLSFLYQGEANNNDRIVLPNIEPDYIIHTPTYQEMVERQIDTLISSEFLKPPNLIGDYS